MADVGDPCRSGSKRTGPGARERLHCRLLGRLSHPIVMLVVAGRVVLETTLPPSPSERTSMENESRKANTAADRAEITEVMRRIVAGDPAAVVTFMDRFGHRVRFVVRRILEDMGRLDVRDDIDELHGLVTDACLVVTDRAAGWSPDGALPWTWAYLAIRAKVGQVVGHRVVELEESLMDDHDTGPPVTVLDELASHGFIRLACRDPYVRLLIDSLRTVSSTRDYEVVLDYVVQKSNGDPSPSQTVATMYDISSANVRQIFSRIRRRLLAAIDEDPDGLGPLLEIWWLAA